MVMFKGDPITLQGTLIRVGQKAPDFSVVTPDMKTLSLKDFQGKVLVISTVPSVDTIVCSLQSQRFEKEAKSLSSVNFLTISLDLPFSLGRFAKEASCTKMPLASDYKERIFAKNYGLLIEGLYLLTRAVIIIDTQGHVGYLQLVSEITHEPDYEDVIRVLKGM